MFKQDFTTLLNTELETAIEKLDQDTKDEVTALLVRVILHDDSFLFPEITFSLLMETDPMQDELNLTELDDEGLILDLFSIGYETHEDVIGGEASKAFVAFQQQLPSLSQAEDEDFERAEVFLLNEFEPILDMLKSAREDGFLSNAFNSPLPIRFDGRQLGETIDEWNQRIQ